ncbi:hypothetical protein B0H12DRAFT_429176 [Mycena haematopus]|nr:hypothetical protein B0H12DRAFT_429176 [Mycena haematopus]
MLMAIFVSSSPSLGPAGTDSDFSPLALNGEDGIISAKCYPSDVGNYTGDTAIPEPAWKCAPLSTCCVLRCTTGCGCACRWAGRRMWYTDESPGYPSSGEPRYAVVAGGESDEHSSVAASWSTLPGGDAVRMCLRVGT